MESGTANLLHMLHARVKKLCDAGDWDAAMNTATAAVDKARASMSDGDAQSVRELAGSLEVKGDFLRQYGYLESSRQAYLEALEVLGSCSDFIEQLARISASVAVVYDMDDNEDEAIRFYRRGIDLYERMDPPSMVDIGILCNNLAYIYKARGDFDQAEGLYLKALEIYHEESPEDSEEMAAICNNVGALYMATHLPEQACEMHTMALEARSKIFGENHLDTAQSHANLALALCDVDKGAEAKAHFKGALKTYEGKLREAPVDYATVSSNYADFLRKSGEEKEAAVVEKRAGKRLKKVS